MEAWVRMKCFFSVHLSAWIFSYSLHTQWQNIYINRTHLYKKSIFMMEWNNNAIVQLTELLVFWLNKHLISGMYPMFVPKQWRHKICSIICSDNLYEKICSWVSKICFNLFGFKYKNVFKNKVSHTVGRLVMLPMRFYWSCGFSFIAILRTNITEKHYILSHSAGKALK